MQKKKRKRIVEKILLFGSLCIVGGFFFPQEVQANLWENPYVTFSPDGLAFTTNAGDRNIEWYSKGYTVYTGQESTLRTPEKGEHLYSVIENGNVRVGKWVADNIGKCVHNAGISISNFHGVEFAKNYCQGYYYSGWWGYCADCNQKAAANYFYMSEAAAATLKELNMSLAYYYLCPWCTHLEQGVELMYHVCKSISANQYSVRYHANFGTGTMPKSVHMYNNATLYEGKSIVPQKTLSPNCYTREGYEFAGWNTRQDGSGRYFSDEEEIHNLCSGEQESIILYAQWVKEADDSLWPVVTEQMVIRSDENVYQDKDVYYVRADGTTPFTVSFNSRIQGPARKNYQINQMSFRIKNLTEGFTEGQLRLVIPVENEMGPGINTYTGIYLSKQFEGEICLDPTSFSEAKRSNHCRNMTISQGFCVGEEMDGMQIRLNPGAGIMLGSTYVVSDPIRDAENGMNLVADGKGPVITGLELLHYLTNRADDAWEYNLGITAQDTGSGLADFWLEIRNEDNGSQYRVEDTDRDGCISVKMESQNPLFAGEFIIIAGAKDNVGNESAETYNVDGISVDAYIDKIREPQSLEFKKGESGRLHIQATGYVDKIVVIFPEEWTHYVPEFNKEYVYEVPVFMRTEDLEFMVPLKVSDAEYTIVVLAYKGEKMVEAKPQLLTITVSGSVLDEIRTRLR